MSEPMRAVRHSTSLLWTLGKSLSLLSGARASSSRHFLASPSHACLSRPFITHLPSALGEEEAVPLYDLGMD